MSSQLQKLMFSISLLDKVTGPAGKVKNSLGSVADTASESFGIISGGVAGMAASGYTLQTLSAPAHDLNMALGDVKSLDVAEKSLEALTGSAMDFSVEYGESAAEFVRSSYDIQSSIAGLAGSELATFTTSSAVLAKATKADAATITDYMGRMYGIFKNSANEMGKAKWVEQLTGQTATAVQMFKTTGAEMAGAFSSLGANATSYGIAQAEQIGILGNLQATVSGSEAGTQYKAFLAGIGNAQDELGMKFTDSQGKMLGVVDILGKLQERYGSTLSVAEGDELKKAFGSDEAVSMIKQLMLDTTGLANSIDAIGKVTGMDKALAMADNRVDVFARWEQGINAVKTGLGGALLPVIYPALNSMADMAGNIYEWTQEHQTLTKYIGFTIIGVVGVSAALATFAAVGSMASLVMGFYGKQTLLSTIIMGTFRNGLALARMSMLFFNAAIWANPATWLVGGILLLIGAVAGAILYWDELKAAFLDTSWGQAIMRVIDNLFGYLDSLGGAFEWVGDKLSWIPGIGGDKPETVSSSPSLSAPRTIETMPGGVSRSVANAVTTNSSSSSKSIHIGQVTTSRPLNSQEINNMLVMAS
ncbi:phage tail tape measure protein [Desulfosediminicola sp.]|uniref:phage tail tape measure protein n=1 Tax=Desulfosediminicola sp. TaxID=2886825 RepID=UPI003AF2FDF0